MTQKEHLELMRKKITAALDVAKAKNDDYTGASGDPFANFRLTEHLGIGTVEEGILTRMCDKVSRIASLLHKSAAVKDESIHDTLIDLSLYSIILSNYIDSKKEVK